MVLIYSTSAWVAYCIPRSVPNVMYVVERIEAFVAYIFVKYSLNYLHYYLKLQQTIDFKSGVDYVSPLCYPGSSSKVDCLCISLSLVYYNVLL